MTAPFRLHAGDSAPSQQSPTTCGAACLTVARMLIDPLFARWILTGEGPRRGVPDAPTLGERFAAYERIVHRRTNGLYAGAGRLNLPWPRRLGTPPWGAKKELEFGAARRDTDYTVEMLRHHSPAELGEHFDRLLAIVADGEPALLYVGTHLVPRHVLLILPDNGDGNLEVYDPARGTVTELTRHAFTSRAVDLAGWDVPWFSVEPVGIVRERAYEWAPGAVPA